MKVRTIGLDLAKRVFQLPWVDRETGEICRWQLKRAQVAECFAKREAAVIAVESCGSAQDREQVRQLAQAVREATGETVHLIVADQGYTGGEAPQGAQAHAITLQLVKHTGAKRGFVLLPRRWMVQRSFGRAARFRRLARAYER